MFHYMFNLRVISNKELFAILTMLCAARDFSEGEGTDFLSNWGRWDSRLNFFTSINDFSMKAAQGK